LGSPLVVEGDGVLYFAAPLFGAYRDHDYWVYREVVKNALRAFLPRPLLKLSGPGWVEATLHEQPADDSHPERRVLHLVAYHPRRTMQPVQHVDQSWPTSGLEVEVLMDHGTPQSVYLGPENRPLDFEVVDGYARIALPPVGAHTTVIIE
jgi:hypothetical protein